MSAEARVPPAVMAARKKARKKTRKLPLGDGPRARRSRENQRQFREATLAIEAEIRGVEAPPEARHEPTPDDLLAVLNAIAEGRTLRSKCRELGVAESTVRMQIGANPQLERQYVIARQAQAHAFAETNIEDFEALEKIDTEADGAHVELGIYKHKFEVRRWTMGKYHIGAYGDKLEVTHEGGDNPVEVIEKTVSPAEAVTRYIEEVKKL